MIRQVVIFTLCSFWTLAHDGMNRNEFFAKLASYFDRDQISDLNKVFPNDVRLDFYSWDAGDFSGDGNYDLACVVRQRVEKGKRVHVYLFVDIDGFLVNIAVKEFRFIELPLEVGVVIRYGVCYITEKLQQYNWCIRGFRFDGVALVNVSEYTTRGVYNYTLQQTLNYTDLMRHERWIVTATNVLTLERKGAIVPLYPRTIQLGHGYQRRASIHTVDFIQRGAYYWGGPQDCSFSMWGAYDSNSIYITIAIHDDHVVTGYCDTCVSDRVELWVDLFDADSSLPSISLRRAKRGVVIRQHSDAPQIGLDIRIGDFRNKPPSTKLLVADSSLLTRLRLMAANNIAVHVEKRSEGYTLRLRIPWVLLKIENLPHYVSMQSIGMLVSVHDIDNEFRPEEETILTSADYKAHVPATMSEFVVLPVGNFLGKVEYIYTDAVIEQLRVRGF